MERVPGRGSSDLVRGVREDASKAVTGRGPKKKEGPGEKDFTRQRQSILKGSVATECVSVSHYCVTNHPKTQKLKSTSIDIAHRYTGQLGLLAQVPDVSCGSCRWLF